MQELYFMHIFLMHGNKEDKLYFLNWSDVKYFWGTSFKIDGTKNDPL